MTPTFAGLGTCKVSNYLSLPSMYCVPFALIQNITARPGGRGVI